MCMDSINGADALWFIFGFDQWRTLLVGGEREARVLAYHGSFSVVILAQLLTLSHCFLLGSIYLISLSSGFLLALDFHTVL